ncbi:hypothetical protein C2W62_16145 [Candidatus Entotheonella serta]|nr:hypothetical protein C2W62_16145 [Candidatus Entotheonella serta]
MSLAIDRLRKMAVTYELYWLILCLIVASCLRLFWLEAQSLWADEGAQHFIASAPTLDVFWERYEQRTFHPPLSFLISHVFLRLHHSDFFLRLPSVLFGVGSLVLAYGLVRKLTSVAVALVAVWVMAISPLHIWYSQEARMYAPLVFIALLSTLTFLWAVETRRWYGWGVYAGTLALGLYLHVFIVLQIMVHGIWLLFWYRHAWWPYCCAGLVSAALAFPIVYPWIHLVLRRVTPGLVEGVVIASKSREIIGWEGLFYALYAYGAGFSLGPSLTALHNDRSLASLISHLPAIAVVALVFGTLLIVGLYGLGRWWSWGLAGQCLIAFAGPIVGAALLTSISSFSFNVRYTIMGFPFFCLLLGVAIIFLGRHRVWLGGAALLAFTLVSSWSLFNYYGLPDYGRNNLRAAVAYWRAASDATDLVTVAGAHGVRDVVVRYLTPAEQHRHTWLGGRNAVDRLRQFLETREGHSVYLLFARDWKQRREAAVRNAFAVHYEKTFAGVKLLKIAQK